MFNINTTNLETHLQGQRKLDVKHLEGTDKLLEDTLIFSI